MNKRPTKADTRQELEAQVAEFLHKGGTIEQIKSGASGLVDGAYHRNSFVHGLPKQARTPVPEVVAAIDARRHSKTSQTSHTFSKHPRKKTIYDDFGEPVREVWVQE